MKYLYYPAIMFIFLFFPQSAGAHFTGTGHIHDTSIKIEKFLNTDCFKNNTCNLKEFTLFLRKYEVWFSDDDNPAYGTAIIVEYETASVADIEKYAIVQFIRGCVYDNKMDEFGNIVEANEVNISHLGNMKIFCFREWVLDSFDLDPVYNSSPEKGRFYFLRWNSVKGSHKKETETYYGVMRPKYPIVYLSDITGVAFRSNLSARNVSLEFKTCIFKDRDVPLIFMENVLNFVDPIKCFNWGSSYIYNWDLHKFETKDELVFP